ncbi:MAG: hypothetical protein ABJM39_11710 [Porticoccus sp.]|uniref:hypothetical protein n=1 Tax=Pseudomonadati TaxID=3379134 RepID=UPI003262FC45
MSDQQITTWQATKQGLAAFRESMRSVIEPIVSDPSLQAMWRMGADEASHALKAFNDSVPITPEMGGMWEPTPQEVFADKQGMSPLESYQRDLYQPEVSQEMER